MKSKPNTEQFKPDKDPSSFLEGGIIDKPEQSNVSNNSDGLSKSHREQKIFRLPMDIIVALKKECYERTIKQGSRVTETELVEQALRDFLDR